MLLEPAACDSLQTLLGWADSVQVVARSMCTGREKVVVRQQLQSSFRRLLRYLSSQLVGRKLRNHRVPPCLNSTAAPNMVDNLSWVEKSTLVQVSCHPVSGQREQGHGGANHVFYLSVLLVTSS
jgi:hypothetical protein